MTVDTGPCTPWPVIWNCDDRVSTSSPEVTGYALDSATSILWALSGRQFGTCPVVLRPCRENCYQSWPTAHPLTYPWSSYGGSPSNWDASYWFGAGCGTCTGGCSCGEVPEVRLPSPAADVTAVKVDGVLLPSSAYRLDNARILVRTDGHRWPRCNNLALDDTQPGTWSVAADIGKAVPVAGQLAVGQLACQIMRAYRGEDCTLPMQVKELVRQGVTVTFPDINDALGKGKTGLYLVDLFLGAVNPQGLHNRARVYAVDGPRVRRAGS